MEKVFEFQHDAENVNLALGLSNEIDIKCIDIILFSAVSNHFLVDELFESKKEAPLQLVTMSGDLEKALSLCTNERERSYVLFIFRQTHELCYEMLTKYEVLNSSDPKEKLKMEIVMKIMDLKLDDISEELGVRHVKMNPTEMFKKIELIKKSRYDYKNYLALSNTGSIDSLLGKVFDDEQQD